MVAIASHPGGNDRAASLTTMMRPRVDRAALLLAALVAAGILAALAALDPVLRDLSPWDLTLPWLPRSIPVLFSCALLFLALVACPLFFARRWLFARRYELVIAALVVPSAVTGLNAGRLDAFDVIMVVLSLAWLGFVLVERRRVAISKLVLALLLGLAVCCLVSVIRGGLQSVVALPSMFGKFVLVVIITTLVASPRHLRLALASLIVVAALSAAIAVASEGVYLVTEYAFTFDDFEDFHFKDTPFGTFLRATALSSTAQALGHLLILALALTLAGPWSRKVRFGVGALLLGGIACTFSIAAYAVTAMVVALAPIARRPEKSFHQLALLAALGLTLYVSGAAQWAYTQVAMIGGEAAEDRVEYIGVALDVIGNYPLTGIGLNNFSRVFYIPVHNAFLQMTAEVGIIGGILFAVLVFWLFAGVILRARVERGHQGEFMLKAMGLAMFAMLVQFLMEPLYTGVASWTFIGFTASAVAIDWSSATAATAEIGGREL